MNAWRSSSTPLSCIRPPNCCGRCPCWIRPQQTLPPALRPVMTVIFWWNTVLMNHWRRGLITSARQSRLRKPKRPPRRPTTYAGILGEVRSIDATLDAADQAHALGKVETCTAAADELIDLQESIPDKLQTGYIWVMSRATVRPSAS